MLPRGHASCFAASGAVAGAPARSQSSLQEQHGCGCRPAPCSSLSSLRERTLVMRTTARAQGSKGRHPGKLAGSSWFRTSEKKSKSMYEVVRICAPTWVPPICGLSCGCVAYIVLRRDAPCLALCSIRDQGGARLSASLAPWHPSTPSQAIFLNSLQKQAQDPAVVGVGSRRQWRLAGERS